VNRTTPHVNPYADALERPACAASPAVADAGRRFYRADCLRWEAGTTAPDFTLPDQEGDDVSLSDFRGSPVVLYFYPRPTRQAAEGAGPLRRGEHCEA
jgi:hypothetical protein